MSPRQESKTAPNRRQRANWTWRKCCQYSWHCSRALRYQVLPVVLPPVAPPPEASSALWMGTRHASTPPAHGRQARQSPRSWSPPVPHANHLLELTKLPPIPSLQLPHTTVTSQPVGASSNRRALRAAVCACVCVCVFVCVAEILKCH